MQSRSIMNKQQKEEQRFVEHMEAQRRKRRWSTYITSSVAVLLGTSGILYLWQPWNPFSTEVSRHLRKGLWLETSKNIDYLKALQHYQDALRQCRKEDMDTLDPRYTGIVLKIAEMYEKLQMVDRQREVYQRLSDFLFAKLVNDEVPGDWKDKVIQRDLVVATRLATLAQPGQTKRVMQELWDRMGYAEQQTVAKFPVLHVRGELDIMEVLQLDSWSAKKKFIEQHLPQAKKFLSQWSVEWPCYMEDLVRARDLYATLAMFTGPRDVAVKVLQSNIFFMKISGLEPIKMSTALLNLASAYYFKSEQHESRSALAGATDTLEKQMFVEHEKTEAQRARDMSARLYRAIISRYQGEDEDSRVCQAMSLYSLGVLNKGQKEAETYFSRAREVAVEHGLVQVIDKIDNETLLPTPLQHV
ncbi:hypothetical protein KL928_001229 [Ogataea angusta]|uniref:Tetratricopeptide repeat protein n=1 Tax=Pichia angusta TaxID=870730 RepID=A0AAN6I8J3_PICAN|nr:uncharacterized protein KL928_001229 [Ogataea angusta]KAG7821145.1 hypothetical protein KL928_001229 [Ogataea angusta]